MLHRCHGRNVIITVIDGEILIEVGRLVRGGNKQREILQMAQGAAQGINPTVA